MPEESNMIAVTGASGKLGGLVVEGLLNVVAADELIAIVRSPEQVSRFAPRGGSVRRGDYTAPETQGSALEGVERLLLISGTEIGKRVEQHRAVIDAAKAAGVRMIAYTSLLKAHSSTLPMAGEHAATETLLRASGLAFVLLRNGFYIENYTERVDTSLARGALLGSARAGRIAAASRADYAAAAVAVLTTEGHDGRTYELAGDRAFTMHELAAAVSTWAGRDIPYRDVPASAHRNALAEAGLPKAMIDFLVATDAAIARGDVDSSSRDLQALIARETRTLQEMLATLPPYAAARTV
jgi:NAD(P)H dehydrogenase (quinone)